MESGMKFKDSFSKYFKAAALLMLCWPLDVFSAQAAERSDHFGIMSELEDFDGTVKEVTLPFPYSSISEEQRETCAFIPQFFYAVLQENTDLDDEELYIESAVLGPLRPCLGIVVHNKSPEAEHKTLVFHVAVDVQGIDSLIDTIADVFTEEEITHVTVTIFTNRLTSDTQDRAGVQPEQQHQFIENLVEALRVHLKECSHELRVRVWTRPYLTAGSGRCEKFFGAQDALFVKANGEIFSTSLFRERIFHEAPIFPETVAEEEKDLITGVSYKKILLHFLEAAFTQEELDRAVDAHDLHCEEITDVGLDWLYQITEEEAE